MNWKLSHAFLFHSNIFRFNSHLTSLIVLKPKKEEFTISPNSYIHANSYKKKKEPSAKVASMIQGSKQ